MAKRAMVMDLDRCTGCMTCIVACKYEHSVDLGEYFCDVAEVGPIGTHPHIDMYWVPFQCQQCENAPCIEVCPTGAAHRADNGVVLVDADACIGCKTCLTGCPYSDPDGAARPSARWYNEATGVVEKCTLCNHLTYQSDGVEDESDTFSAAHAVPPCVHNCCNKARYFGDLDDENSAASQYLAKQMDAGRSALSLETEGAEASFVYLMTDESRWQGIEGLKVLKADA